MALGAISSCNNDLERSGTSIHIDPAAQLKGKYSEIFKEVRVTPLSTSKEGLISSIMKIDIDDDRIFILDTKAKKIFLFNINGEFIASIGKKGKGPGEFLSVNDYSLNRNKNTIEVLDSANNKILRFDYNGNYLGSNNSVFAMGFGSLGEEYYVFYHYNFIFRDSNGTDIDSDIVITNDKGKIIKNFSLGLVNRNLALTTYTNITQDMNGDILILPIFENQIYRISKDMILQNEVEINLPNQPPREFYSEHNDVRTLLMNLDQNSSPNRLQRIIATNNHYYMYYFVKNKINQIFINKKSNEVKVICEGETLNDLFINSSRFFKGGYDNGLIQTMEAFDFLKAFESSGSTSKVKSIQLRHEINKIMQDLKPDDNPVLIFYNYK